MGKKRVEKDKYPPIIIGIDPGKEPAATVIIPGHSFENFKFKKFGDEFDFKSFQNFLCSFLNDFSPEGDRDMYEAYIFIEDVHSVYGASAKANFQFGRSVGLIRGMVEAESALCDYPAHITMVPPKTWQKCIIEEQDIVKNGDGKRDTKASALMCAKRIIGDGWNDEDFLPTERSKKVSHDMVDSFLIAKYGEICFLKLKK